MDQFFDSVLLAIEKLVPIDDKIVDLCHYSQNRVIDITYQPGRIFSTQFDWSKYIETGQLDKIYKTYQIQDTQVLVGGKWFDIDWEQYRGSINYYTHYVYRSCYDYRSKKTASSIQEI
jgi:hypothetical protein